MTSYKGLYVQRLPDGVIFNVQVEYQGGEIGLEPQTYIGRGAQPPIDQLPDVGEYLKAKRPIEADGDPRMQFLAAVHQEAHGDQSKQVNAAAVATKLGMDEEALRRVAQYLAGEGLIEVKATLHRIPAFVAITHSGVKAAEAGAL